MFPEVPQNILGLSIFSFVVFVVVMLIFVSVIFFVILVSYLGQWDIYWPGLHLWLRAQKAKSLEKARKKKNIQRKLEKKHG